MPPCTRLLVPAPAPAILLLPGSRHLLPRRPAARLLLLRLLADPPFVSYCVSRPRAAGSSSKPTEFGREPIVVATEADLVLLSFVLGSLSNFCNRRMHDYYVYQAGGGGGARPSTLTLFPRPGPGVFPQDTLYYFRSRQAGLLRYGGGGYIVAVLRTLGTVPETFGICTFDSKTNTWSRRLAALDEHQQGPEFPDACHRVITIGGGEAAGTMGWVDLWRGITFCDVLADESLAPLRYVPLPPSILANNRFNGPVSMYRDIAVVRGCIKYVEVQMHVRPVSSKPGSFVSDGWTANDSGGWRKDCKVHAHEVSSVDDNGNTVAGFELLLTLWDQGRSWYTSIGCSFATVWDDKGTLQPTLERIHIGHPTLSLCGDDIVYLMAKVDHRGPEAWVIGLDTEEDAASSRIWWRTKTPQHEQILHAQ